MVTYLVEECDADVEQTGTIMFEGDSVESVTPLWCASAAGNLDTVIYLVNRGANVNRTTVTSSTALRAACFDGHENVVRFLVQNGGDFEIHNRHGHTCLMISCYRGHNAITEYLLQQGARVNRQSTKGNTALHDCAESGNLDALKLLIAHRTIMRKDECGLTPLLASANSGFKPVHFLINLSNNSEEKTRSFSIRNKRLRMYNVSLDERIAAYELLGASLIDRNNEMEQTLQLWHQATHLRTVHSRPKYKAECDGSLWSILEQSAREAITDFELEEQQEIFHDPFHPSSYSQAPIKQNFFQVRMQSFYDVPVQISWSIKKRRYRFTGFGALLGPRRQIRHAKVPRVHRAEVLPSKSCP
ncbi:hypothetical protein Ciccas_003377 [Cichlidogyrus casuarinus]|uniref:Uncharacterized protein n=1 Tax=Cichlidogyrus casuarinus TaxID=1844966 RepID=A0ABD2QEL9_9PLAT